jgi:kinesin family protein 3/17
MEGKPEVKELRGIIPNSFEHIFDSIALTEHKVTLHPTRHFGIATRSQLIHFQQFLVKASFLEIYNETIRDLLSKDPEATLDLKEHPETGFFVNVTHLVPRSHEFTFIKGLSSVMVKSISEIDHVMKMGSKNRTTGETLMNRNSSRSHSIFTVVVEVNEEGVDGKPLIRAGKLNLVDLAGE